MNKSQKSDNKNLAGERLMIYQVLPRLLTNMTGNCEPNGALERNGSGKLNDYTSSLLASIRDLGINCIWYTGIIENATKSDFSAHGIVPDNPNVVKGEAGSPYAIKDYYDVSPCLAVDIDRRMEEFEALVRRTHEAGMKVMIDFVPNHTARQYHSDAAPAGMKDFGADDDTTLMFSPSNNYYYITSQQFAPQFPINGYGKPYVEFPAKATGNDCFSAFPTEYDWYETVKLNYGHDYGDGSDHFFPIPDTWIRMRDILMFWASKGVDAFRCDMVFMVPLAFWHWVIPQVRHRYGTLFIGEIYDIASYRPFLDYGSFDYLYDKVNLYDTLVGIETSSVSAARLTGCWQAVDGIGERMLNFLENHDEVRFASAAYGGNPAYVVPSLVVSAMMSRGPFMIYFGQELGESARDNEGFAGNNHRTSIFDYWSYDTMRRWYDSGRCGEELLTAQERWLRRLYRKVIRLCNEDEALRSGDFFDLMYVNLRNPGFDPNCIYAFIRYVRDEEAILIVANFSHTAHEVSINIPQLAFDMTGLPQADAVATDLLTGAEMMLTLSPSAPTLVRVGPKDALVLRLCLKESKPKLNNTNTRTIS